MTIVAVSSNGEIVMPAEIRKACSIKRGDRFELRVSGGKLVLAPLKEKPLVRLYGAFKGGTSLVRALEDEHAREIENRWTGHLLVDAGLAALAAVAEADARKN